MDNGLKELTPFLDNEGLLISLPAKNKKKLMAIWYLAQKIEPERTYTEAEINSLLNRWTTFNDPAILRRELYNKRLLDRTPDCSLYKKESEIPTLADFISRYI